MVVEDQTKLFERFSLVCDGCGAKEPVSFDTVQELEHYCYHEHGTIGWIGSRGKHWCPACRIDGWW